MAAWDDDLTWSGKVNKEVKKMATVSKAIAEEIIANDGHYMDDPKVVKVVKYENQFNGADAYALVYEMDPYYKYEQAAACHNVQVLWEAGR